MRESAINPLSRYSLTGKLMFLYAAALPFMRLPGLNSLSSKVQYSDLIFSVLFLSWVFSCIKGRVFPSKAAGQNFLLLALTVFLLGFRNSRDILYTGIEFAAFVYLAAMYYLVNSVCASRRMFYDVLRLWTGMAYFVAAAGIMGYILYAFSHYNWFGVILDYSPSYSSANRMLLTRIQSFFSHPNMFSSYLHVSSVFLLILIPQIKRKTFRYAAFVFLFIFIFCLFAAKSRITSGVFLSFSIVLFSLGKERVFKALKPLTAVFAFLLMAVSLITVIWWVFPVSYGVNPSTSRYEIKINTVHAPYYYQHQAALLMAGDQPFLGVGIGNYYLRSREYMDWQSARESYLMMDPGLSKYYNKNVDPHSTYLGWLAETGILGISALIAFIVSVIGGLRKTMRAPGQQGCRYTAVCFLAGIAGFLWNGVYIDIITMRHFWFLLAMASIFASGFKDKEGVC